MYRYYNAKYLTSRKSVPICSALLEFGYSLFSLEILEYCAREDCITREDYYLSILKPEYNVSKSASSPPLGRYHSSETKKKISATKLTSEAKLSKETKEESVVPSIRVEVLNKNTGETRFYASVNEAAIALSCSSDTVSRYIKSGKLFKGNFKMSKKL